MESHWALCSYIIILRMPILSPQTDPDALSSQDLHYSSSPALQPQPSVAKARQEGRHFSIYYLNDALSEFSVGLQKYLYLFRLADREIHVLLSFHYN